VASNLGTVGTLECTSIYGGGGGGCLAGIKLFDKLIILVDNAHPALGWGIV